MVCVPFLTLSLESGVQRRLRAQLSSARPHLQCSWPCGLSCSTSCQTDILGKAEWLWLAAAGWMWSISWIPAPLGQVLTPLSSPPVLPGTQPPASPPQFSALPTPRAAECTLTYSDRQPPGPEKEEHCSPHLLAWH